MIGSYNQLRIAEKQTEPRKSATQQCFIPVLQPGSKKIIFKLNAATLHAQHFVNIVVMVLYMIDGEIKHFPAGKFTE